MVVERAVGLGGPFERKSAGDVDLERAGFDQPVELGDHLLAKLDVVAAHAHAMRGLRLRHNAVGMGRAASVADSL